MAMMATSGAHGGARLPAQRFAAVRPARGVNLTCTTEPRSGTACEAAVDLQRPLSYLLPGVAIVEAGLETPQLVVA
jgi:hypothetical protein